MSSPEASGLSRAERGSGLLMFESPSQRLRLTHLNPHHTTGWGWGAPLLLREGHPALSQDAVRQAWSGAFWPQIQGFYCRVRVAS